MRCCCACGIKSQTAAKRNISFHRFPKDNVLRKAWINAIGREEYVPAKTSVICSLHFPDDCLYYSTGEKKKRLLCDGSVPTKFGFRTSNRCIKETHCSDIDSESQKSNLEVSPLRTLQNDNQHPKEIIKVTVISPNTKNTNVRDYLEEINDSRITFLTDHLTNSCYSETKVAENYQPLSKSKSIVCDHNYSKTAATAVIQQDTKSPQEQGNTKKCPTIRLRKFRGGNPRFVGDCEEIHLVSPLQAKRNWQIAMTQIKELRKKVATLKQSKRRLQMRVNTLQCLLSELTDLIS